MTWAGIARGRGVGADIRSDDKQPDFKMLRFRLRRQLFYLLPQSKGLVAQGQASRTCDMPLMSLAVRRLSHICLSRSHRRFFLKRCSMVAVPFGWCNYPNLVQGRSKLRRVFNR